MDKDKMKGRRRNGNGPTNQTKSRNGSEYTIRSNGRKWIAVGEYRYERTYNNLLAFSIMSKYIGISISIKVTVIGLEQW